MSASEDIFRPLDPGRVNIMDPLEIQYWCGALHCSPATLEDIVEEVGEHVSAIRQRLEASVQAQSHPPQGHRTSIS